MRHLIGNMVGYYDHSESKRVVHDLGLATSLMFSVVTLCSRTLQRDLLMAVEVVRNGSVWADHSYVRTTIHGLYVGCRSYRI